LRVKKADQPKRYPYMNTLLSGEFLPRLNSWAWARSHGIVTASLQEFARTGQLGPIVLGFTRLEVSEQLGPPTNWSDDNNIWKYGDAEIYFEDNQVWLIHFDWFEVPVGSPALKLQPWIVRLGLLLPDLETGFRQVGIEFKSYHPDPWNDDCVKVVTSAGVYFVLCVEGNPDELGLRIFGLCR